MEQNNIERMKRAAKILIDKIDRHNSEYETFKKEFWTPEIRKMVNTIIDHRKIECYKYNIELQNGYSFYTNEFKFCNCNEACYVYMSGKPVCNNYDQCELDRLKYYAERFNDSQKAFQMLQDNADYIIKKITDDYKDITEKQSDELDSVFDLIGIDEPKTRHIKVTVEWI